MPFSTSNDIELEETRQRVHVMETERDALKMQVSSLKDKQKEKEQVLSA